MGDGSATAVDEQPQGCGDSDEQPRGRRRAARKLGRGGSRDGQSRRRRGQWWPPGRAATEAAEAAMGTHGGGGERMVVETGD